MLDQAIGRFSSDLAIDLGTSNTLVLVKGRGVVVEEPSVVAVKQHGTASAQQVVAVGAEAKRMVGRTPENIQAVRPIREGRIVDFELAEVLMRTCVQKALGKHPLVKPRMIVCVPVGTVEVERRAILESARSSGAREVRLVGKSTAAALGAELPIHDAVASLVVDIGGGTTEIGLISMGGIIVNASVRAAGDHMDRALVAAIQQRHNVLIGERTAEELKLRIGRASMEPDAPAEARVKGRDLGTGIPKDVTITAADLVAAFDPIIDQIVEGLRRALSRTPPELAADIYNQGVMLCGGGALLPGLDRVLSHRTGLNVLIADDPRRCAVFGAAQLLDDAETLQRVSPVVSPV